MQDEDQKAVVALVDRFIEFMRAPIAQARADATGTHIKVPIPNGFLRAKEEWRDTHTDELNRRIVAATWLPERRVSTGELDGRIAWTAGPYIYLYFPKPT